MNPHRRLRRKPELTTRKEISTVTASRRLPIYLTAVALMLGLASLIPTAAAAAPAPAWGLSITTSPTNFDPANVAQQNGYVVSAVNYGSATIEGSDVELSLALPPGITLNESPELVFFGLRAYTDGEYNYGECAAESPGVVCKFNEPIKVPPGQEVTVQVPVTTDPSLTGTMQTAAITVSGGGAEEATKTVTTLISPEVAPPGFEPTSLENWITDETGAAETRAGAHPVQYHFAFQVNTGYEPSNFSPGPVGSPRNVTTTLPRGLIINPQATPVLCTEAQLEANRCPDASAVGVAHTYIGATEYTSRFDNEPLYAMVPPPGHAAAFAFQPFQLKLYIHLLGGIDTAGDYSLQAVAKDIPQFTHPAGVALEIWGQPTDPIHNSRRGECGYLYANSETSCPLLPSEQDETPLLTMPSACSGPLSTRIEVESWEDPSSPYGADIPATDLLGNPVGVGDCGSLDFNGSLKARPTTNVADSPTGLDAQLHLARSEENVSTRASANLKDVSLTLPPGLVINPSGANGLGACSAAQFGLTSAPGAAPIRTDASPATCPDASKLGSLEGTTPLLDHPVKGTVYIAKPYENPFNSLLALYLTVNDEQSGTVLKLAGKVTPDPQTGQLTATFTENPEVPVDDLNLHFDGGSRGPLRTPAACGTYTTNALLTPWSAPESGPPLESQDQWTIEQGANGGSCASSAATQPSSPSFDAGTVSLIAGSYTPLVVNLRREDGTQQFGTVTLNPPPGLVGKLAGIPYCPQSALDAAAAKTGQEEIASPSCPAASRLGTVDVAAGAGPEPFNAKGNVYLTGPYKGAPISLAIVTPATAGPFDLGNAVVRTALFVDSKTAQIKAVSDPLPSILKGIPLDIRSAQVKLDRPEFSLNPTSCDPMSFGGQLTSLYGQASPVSNRFQLAECGRLGFKPKLTLKLKGGTARNDHPALTATLLPGGTANLANLSVALPHSEFLDQAHIGTVCTRVQFAASACPAASAYGKATVTTPLLDEPLTGPVYLRSSDNQLPDLVPDLRGPASQPIKLESAGRIDSIHGGIRTTFETVPDAPFTKLVLQMQGGRKGLLVNSTDICKRQNAARVKFIAHNGATLEAHPPLQANCRKARKHHKKGKGKHKRDRSARAER